MRKLPWHMSIVVQPATKARFDDVATRSPTSRPCRRHRLGLRRVPARGDAAGPALTGAAGAEGRPGVALAQAPEVNRQLTKVNRPSGPGRNGRTSVTASVL